MSFPNANHARFQEHVRQSEPARWRIAQWLVSQGYSVRLLPMQLAATHDQWREHADNGDIEICMRIEVKHLSRDFTSRTDWPFGDKFIVCARHAFDRAKPKPYAFVILNRNQTHVACVLAAGCKEWRIEKRQDSRYQGVTQEFYLAPLSQVIFGKLSGRTEEPSPASMKETI